MESGSSAMVTFDLSFGFDNPNFSDRTLLLEIIADGNDGGFYRLRNVKRYCSHDVLTNASIHTTLSPPPLVKTIHISSLILAGRSQFFRKLFSNGMQESEQKHVILRIQALEEDSFMDLLKYVYSNNLPTTFDALLDLSFTADKFEVASCLRDCAQSLKNITMTGESAAVYLDLPPNLLMSPAFQPLINAAKKFFATKFKDLSTCKEEVLDLALPSFEAVLSSDDLVVSSEIEVYDCVLKWVDKHYPDLEEKREILKTHLLPLVRFPFMTTQELTEKVQSCSYIDPLFVSKIVIDALSFKAETNSHRKRCLATGGRQFVERAYTYRPVKVIEFELPHPQCVVYLNLTRNELKRMFPEGEIWSETFHLDGRELDFCARCFTSVQSNQPTFQLGLKMRGSKCTVVHDFSITRKPKKDHEYEVWVRGNHTFTGLEGDSVDFFTLEWSRFIGKNSSHFVNGILHIRLDLTIIK